MTSIAASANAVQDLVRDAVESRTSLRIAGRSHWIDAGRPVPATRIASLATHEGVVDYVPGDLTITVKGGTTLREIERITRAEGQWLPLDPFGSADGTIGATIATGSFGPLAHAFGRARDLVLGVEFVTGDGKVVRGGGRVVKNVAGFDLVRLITGSWGTLGIITEATLRLYSHHGEPVTLAMSVPDQVNALAQRINSILTASVVPFALELVSGSTAAYLGLSAKPVILIELGGNAASVSAQRNTLAALGGMTEIAPNVWEKLGVAEDKVRSAESVASARARDSRSPLGTAGSGTVSPVVFRLSSLPGRVAEIWTVAANATSGIDGALMHATPGLGVVRCVVPSATARDAIERIAASLPDVTIVYERLPSTMWQSLSPSVVSDRISRGIKAAFDPHGILNPGILGPAS